jgi:hypothetical protein
VQLALPSPRPAPGAAQPEPLSKPVFVAPPAGDYSQILVRPLFSPTRSMVAGGVGAGTRLSDFKLAGTAIARGVALAFFRGPDGKMQSLRRDEQLLDWRLVAIRRDAVVVQANGLQRVIPVGGSAAAGPQ